MPQILDGISSRWADYQTNTTQVNGTNAYPLEAKFAQVSGAHGGVFLASLYGVLDPAGTLIIDSNDDKYIFIYDANATQLNADMKYPRQIIVCKSKQAFKYDAPWEEIEFFNRWPSDKSVEKHFADGRYAPFNEGVRVYASSTMDKLTPLDSVLGITQGRVMLCSCGG